MEQLGLPADLLGDANDRTIEFPLWPENKPIVDAFIAVATQWRVVTLASGRAWWQGLDYTAVRAGLEMADIRLTPAQWFGVQQMERTASATLNGYRG